MSVAATSSPLSTDAKRQVFYASLLRFEPAMRSLREAALDRFVLGALIESDEQHSLRVGEVQKGLNFGAGAPRLRDSAVQDALRRLMDARKVAHTTKLTRHAYYLTPEGAADVAKTLDSGANLFDRVLRRVLRDTEPLMPFETASAICRIFLCECLAQFGRHFARIATGRWNRDDFNRAVNVNAVFSSAVRGFVLTPAARESLESRCVGLLHSTHHDDQRLKLYLTQSYYFTQLLGFEGKQQFDPLAEEAFRGAVFYLDTNVLLPAIVLNDANARMFEEMAGVAKTLGISLRVTRATINETRRVAANRRMLLNTIVAVVPKDLAERTNDPFLVAFLDALERDPELTPDVFMEPFDRLSDVLAGIGVEIDDRIEDEMIGDADVTYETQIVQEEARTRGWGKSDDTLRHDLAHFKLVEAERVTHDRTWFMTRDRTLAQAAGRLAKDEEHPPFSFGLIAFLHSISPFITTTGTDQSLAAVYSKFLTENLLPTESVFDIADLAVLAEMYEDAYATPPDRLIPALDYVKRRVLQGRPFTNDDVPRIALELRKFLTRSSDEQQEALRAEAARLEADIARHRADIERERRARTAAESAAESHSSDNLRLRQEIAAMQKHGEYQDEQITRLRADLDGSAHRRRRAVMLFGFAVGAVLLAFQGKLIELAVSSWPALTPGDYWLGAGATFLSVFLFAGPAIAFLRKAPWSSERRQCGVVVVLAVALATSRLLDDQTAAQWADILAIATLGGAALIKPDGGR